MSQAVGGCHAGADEKIGRLDERSQFSIERNQGCKISAIVALVVAILALFLAWTSLRDLDAAKQQIQELKYSSQKLEECATDARRAYEAARKHRQRNP